VLLTSRAYDSSVSSPLTAVTVLSRDGDRVTFRCRDLHDSAGMSVTRSFVLLMLSVASPDGETTAGMRRAAQLHGVVEPPSNDEATQVFAPWIGSVIRSTRIVSRRTPLATEHEELVRMLRERAGDPLLTWESLHRMPNRVREDLLSEVGGHYELEATFASEELAREVEPGWVFDTYAWDAWWEDPTNPLAGDAERALWSTRVASLERTREEDERREAASLDESVSTWLSGAEERGWLEVREDGRRRLIRALTKELQRAAREDEAPEEMAAALAEILFDHDDVEEVYASDADLRVGLAQLAELA